MINSTLPRNRHVMQPTAAASATRGFTLTELVVCIAIVAVLAAIAVPRFVNIGRDARIAAVQAGMGALVTAQHLSKLKCYLAPKCGNAMSASGPVVGPGGQVKAMLYGYPSSLLSNATYHVITDWVQMDGFTPVLTGVSGAYHTEFQLIGAPDPTQCKATYNEHNTGVTVFTTTTTSGC